MFFFSNNNSSSSGGNSSTPSSSSSPSSSPTCSSPRRRATPPTMTTTTKMDYSSPFLEDRTGSNAHINITTTTPQRSSSSGLKLPPASRRPWTHGIATPSPPPPPTSQPTAGAIVREEKKEDDASNPRQQQQHQPQAHPISFSMLDPEQQAPFDDTDDPQQQSTSTPTATTTSTTPLDTDVLRSSLRSSTSSTGSRNSSSPTKEPPPRFNAPQRKSIMGSILNILQQSGNAQQLLDDDDDNNNDGHHHHHHQQQHHHEATPLLPPALLVEENDNDSANDNNNGHHHRPSYHSEAVDRKAQQERMTPSKSALAWQVIRRKVHSGDLLLRRYSGLQQHFELQQQQQQEQLQQLYDSDSGHSSSPHNPPDPSSFSPMMMDSTIAKRKEEMQQLLRNGLEFSMTQCFILFGIFMAISVVAFSFWFDHWSLIDAMYFAVVTCTTVGYGDLVPDSLSGRIFTCLYAFLGVCFLGIALGVLGNHIVEAQESAVEHTSTIAKKRLLTLFSSPAASNNTATTPSPAATTTTGGKTKDTDDDEEEEEEEVELFAEQLEEAEEEGRRLGEPRAGQVPLSGSHRSLICQLFIHWLLVMFLLLIFAFCIVQDSGISTTATTTGGGNGSEGTGLLLDALYFTIVTATTVGYGDYSPESPRGRLLAIFFIPLAVGAMGHFLSSVAEAIMETRAEAVRKQFASRELSIHDLEIMDVDGDGKVTRAEFLEFMLVALNKVDHEFITEMRQHFAKLDVDGTGVLSKDDLIEQARRKLKRIHHKLELAAYKQKLLQQAAAQRRRRRRSGRLWMKMNPLAQNINRQFRRASSFLAASMRPQHHTSQSQQQSQSRQQCRANNQALARGLAQLREEEDEQDEENDNDDCDHEREMNRFPQQRPNSQSPWAAAAASVAASSRSSDGESTA